MIELPYDLETLGAPQIGLIVLQSDETIERDMRRLIPDEVETLVSRVPSGTHVTPDTLAAMEAELQRAAHLLPAGAQLSAIGYGCTSGTAQIGADRVATAIRAGIATPHVTEPVSALIATCRHLGAQRIGLLSPYIESVTDKLRDALNAAEIEVCAFGSFNESEERHVARIAPASIRSAAAELAAAATMDALFISCTNLRTLDVIIDIEADISVPVLTSNQVLAWDLLRLMKCDVQHAYAGKLYM